MRKSREVKPVLTETLRIHQGQTILVPAGAKEMTLTPDEGGMKILTSYI